VDTFSNVAFAKLYTDKTALAATDFLNDKILPFFDSHGIALLRTLTTVGPNIAAYRISTRTNYFAISTTLSIAGRPVSSSHLNVIFML
jgi:hypothetical protein